MPPLALDRRFGIQLSNYQEPTTNWQTGNWQRAGCAGRVFWYALCGTHACWHLAAFYDLGFFFVCPILRPFNGISSSLLPLLLRLLYSYYYYL